MKKESFVFLAVTTFATTAKPTQDVPSTTAINLLPSPSRTTSDMRLTATTVGSTREIGTKEQRQASQGKGNILEFLVV